MQKDDARSLARISRWTLGLLGVLLAVLTLLPLIETNVWWIRMLDFARLQELAALALVLVLYLVLARPLRAAGWVPVAAMAAAIGYNVYKLHPYAEPFGENSVAVAAAECPAGSRIRVLIANVRMGNRQAGELLRIVRDVRPDLFLAMETDEWWDRQLSVLAPEFSHRVQDVRGNYFGMHLFSKYELADADVRFIIGDETPAIFTNVVLPDGERVDFYGLHPRPPHLWQPSTKRDAQLLLAALEARSAEDPVIVAGDFNAVPWERVVRRAMRIGGLLDPRAGRGIVPTYNAQRWVVTWPLDQVLYQHEFALVEFRHLPEFGSDHYPVLADLCHLPGAAEWQEAPRLAANDLAEAERSINAALTMSSNTASARQTR
ncbi:MAG TPA: endonuclease/exonuclease/phosphatase family protein [Azospirillum sp.]|nr:endonuclease/exonuclease/phosphatase family protein [Azospirillum sp.]